MEMKMSEKLLKLVQAQTIATNYVCQKGHVPNTSVSIDSFEPFSWSGIPAFLFRGKITEQTVDTTNPKIWQAGISEIHTFSIWIAANEGDVIGFRLGECVKNKDNQSGASGNQIERELKQSEIERNRSDIERNNYEIHRREEEDFFREQQEKQQEYERKMFEGLDFDPFKLG
jgi:hypothetical protein